MVLFRYITSAKGVADMEKVIRWGIAGPGNIARKFAKAVKNVEGAALSCVAARSFEKAQKFACDFDIPNAFGSFEEMAKSGLVDAVYVATPHTLHKPGAEIFLKAGKHVLCEKPVCVNAGEAKALYECAKENGVFLMEAMWTRFLPAINEAVKCVNSGVIGNIRGVSADFCYSCTPEQVERIYRNDMAGGALLDVGIYGLTFASVFFGDYPESVKAVADIDYGVDCQIDVVMKYDGGKTARVSSAINAVKPENAYVYGSDGYIEVPMFYGAKEFYICKGNERILVQKPSIGDGFAEEIIEACNCIREGKTQSDVMPMSLSITKITLAMTIV